MISCLGDDAPPCHRDTTHSLPSLHLPNKQPPTTTTDDAESFPELETAITAAIATLGGAVCPKLSWSVPRDAAWVNGGTLKCATAGDVMLLLKSSDFVQHDLGRLL